MRYLKVRGRAGVLVANPHAIGANPPRYAGQRRKPKAHEIREHAERYEPVEEVLQDEPSLRKAARAGEIEIIAVGVKHTSGSEMQWSEAPPVAEPENAPVQGGKPRKDR